MNMYFRGHATEQAFNDRPGRVSWGDREPFSGHLGAFAGPRSAEERITEDDFEVVLKVLTGRSLWQQYLTENLRLARRNLPSRPFRVVKRADFEQAIAELGGNYDASHIPGLTNKRTGIITMQEFFGINSRATFLGAALHEAVHLVSYPPGRGSQPVSRAFGILGEGLLEGLVECVTIDVLNGQDIALAKPEWRGHVKRVPVAVAMLRRLGIPLLARLLFGGEYQQFMQLMHNTYSVPGWEEIKRLATADKPERAIQRMRELSTAQQQSRSRLAPGQTR